MARATPADRDEAFREAFADLRGLLAAHAPPMRVERDEPDAYALEAGRSERWGRVLPFGSVEILKSYVSFHLFPVYVFPELPEDLSPELRDRMQGKSCFNFRGPGEVPREELRELGERGFGRYEEEGLLP